MIRFEEISSSQAHNELTYEFLKKRQNPISHRCLPLYEEHCDFIANHPYRHWFLIWLDDSVVGTIYLHTDNSIGLDIDVKYQYLIGDILAKTQENYNPLPPIKSVRNAYFFINISPDNSELIHKIKNYGAIEIQRSFLLD